MFEAEIQYFEQLHGTENFDCSSFKIRKQNKTRKVYGTVIMHMPLDNSVMVRFEAFKKQGGEYRKLPYRLPPMPQCETTKGNNTYYEDLSKVSDFPYPAPCPFPIVSVNK